MIPLDLMMDVVEGCGIPEEELEGVEGEVVAAVVVDCLFYVSEVSADSWT